jgi:predicted nucleic acid-binding protein
MKLVLDTNIVIAALLRDSAIRRYMLRTHNSLYVPEFVFYEIEEHRDELLTKTGLSDGEFNLVLSLLQKYLHIIPDKSLIKYKKEAEAVIAKIDRDDVPIVAAALACNGSRIWSDDAHLRKQRKVPVLRTAEVLVV